MKKMLLALLAVCVAGIASASTPTNTPTSTITPTYTPTAVAIKDRSYTRECFDYSRFKQADGITGLLTSANAGPSAYAYLSVSYSCAALGTASAEVRLQFTIPNDYNTNGRFYCYGLPQTAGQSAIGLSVTVNVEHFNFLTSTSTTYPGAWTNIQTQYYCPLQDSVLSRFALPVSLALFSGMPSPTPTATATPVGTPTITPTATPVYATTGIAAGYGTFHPGDLVGLDIVRSGGTGNLYLFDCEFEYKPVMGRYK